MSVSTALASQNIGSRMTSSVLSLSGYMGRTNNVILYHVVGAKKNVIYFPGDTQVRCYSISSMVLLVWYGTDYIICADLTRSTYKRTRL